MHDPTTQETAMEVKICTIVMVLYFSFQVCFAQVEDGSQCKNELPTKVCKRYEKFGACVKMYKRMKKLCSKTCEFCGDICRDRFKRQCRVWVYHGTCRTHRTLMKSLCRESCGFCVASAPPKEPSCQNTTFGCCWDGVRAAIGPKQYGCGRCEDKLLFCRFFYEDCIGGRNRAFMLRRCPSTCKLCNKDQN